MCRERRKQKLAEMGKIVESLKSQLRGFDAAKRNVEGLLIENTMLRRIVQQQAACIAVLRGQLLESNTFLKNGCTLPLMRRHSYHSDASRWSGDLATPFIENSERRPQNSYATPSVPLPGNQVDPHDAPVNEVLSKSAPVTPTG